MIGHLGDFPASLDSRTTIRRGCANPGSPSRFAAPLLPVIVSLNDLLRSGDNIHTMEAVLSGTLNFVFNNYDGKKSFASVVKQAQEVRRRINMVSGGETSGNVGSLSTTLARANGSAAAEGTAATFP